jgi:hypothetical protein
MSTAANMSIVTAHPRALGAQKHMEAEPPQTRDGAGMRTGQRDVEVD